VGPRPAELVRDYIRYVGGSTAAYKGELPPHLFPQWGFPVQARTLADVPYDLTKVLNGGCRIEWNAPLAADEPLHVRTWLDDIDDDGRRAVLRQKLITGTREHPEALVTTTYAIVPLPRESGEKRAKKERPRVGVDAREVARWGLGPKAGLDFALLTGDFNPVHWVAPYARMAGFKNTINHGFSTLAHAIESLNTGIWAGNAHRWHSIDVKFVRPLVLPATVGVFVDGNDFAVGDAPGGPAYLTGTFTLRED
jgi:acyl dehydratase